MAPSNLDWDTDVAARARDFPSTCWSKFVGSWPGGGPGAARAAEELAKRYWKPVYAYIRVKWGKGVEDAKDLTQDFFAWMIESEFASRADRRRGRFRTFVKVALENYLLSSERRIQALKRGGGRPLLRLEPGGDDPGSPDVVDGARLTPDQVLDEAWRNELFTRAASILREDFRKQDKELQLRIFQDYYLSEAEDVDYRTVAKRLEVSEAQVFQMLRQARERFRAIVIDLIQETVQGPDELREELAELFGEASA